MRPVRASVENSRGLMAGVTLRGVLVRRRRVCHRKSRRLLPGDQDNAMARDSPTEPIANMLRFSRRQRLP